MMQYQWGQSNLTAKTGTTISPNSTGNSSPPPSSNPTSPTQQEENESPDDGYTTSGSGQDNVQSVSLRF
jgi:mannan endo-1,4-beta-mannosidase